MANGRTEAVEAPLPGRKVSFGKALMVFSAIAASLPLLLLSPLLMKDLKHDLLSGFHLENHAAIMALCERVRTEVEILKSETAIYAMNDDVTLVLDEPLFLYPAQRSLQKLMDRHPELAGIVLLNASGAPILTLQAASEQPNFTSALLSALPKPSVSSLESSAASDEPHIEGYAVTLTGDLARTLLILKTLIHQPNHETQPRALGELVLSIDPSLLARRQVDGLKELAHKGIEMALRDRRIFSQRPAGGTNSLLSTAETRSCALGMPFQFVLSEPEHKRLATVNQAIMRLWAIFAAVLACALGLMWWVAHKFLIEPLNDLRDQALGYAAGKIDAPYEGTHLLELSQMAQAFETLVHSLKSHAAALQNEKTKADKANSAKSEFLASMSHEIRSPLGLILGFSEFLQEDKLSDFDRKNYASKIRQNGNNLLEILNEILDLSKIEAGRLDVDLRPVTLAAFISELDALFGSQVRSKGLRLRVQTCPPLPAVIITDAMRLRQILINLMSNAIKFTDQGEVSLEVRMTQSWLDFVVHDTGIGIAQNEQQKLFVAYEQGAPGITARFGGTGLGLTLSRNLAALLRGELFLAESTLGKGSTFVLRLRPEVLQPADTLVASEQGKPNVTSAILLPSIQASEAPASIETGLPHSPGAFQNGERLKGLRILIVDDTPDNRLLISRILLLEGAFIEDAGDGASGVKKALAGNFDIVLMDIQMPRMDGLQAMAILRNSGFKRPILALTAYAMKQDHERFRLAGFDDTITKPISRESLVSKIKTFSQRLPTLTSNVLAE